MISAFRKKFAKEHNDLTKKLDSAATPPGALAWPASSALAGCVLGAAGVGWGGDRLGPHKILRIFALYFLVSAIGTAIEPSITWFVGHQITGTYRSTASTDKRLHPKRIVLIQRRGANEHLG